jgi:hypothetical protein
MGLWVGRTMRAMASWSDCLSVTLGSLEDIWTNKLAHGKGTVTCGVCGERVEDGNANCGGCSRGGEDKAQYII